jgi:pimeloyl-ACP methyl ester carboxylesterase
MTPPHEYRLVDGVGHFLHVEQPDVVNPMVVDWLTAS